MGLPKAHNLLAAILAVLLIIAAGLVIAQDQETLRVRTSLGADEPQFPEYLARLVGHGLTSGDAYTIHTNGDHAFPAMLAAIAAAKHRISFETYIYDKGQVGRLFTDAFARAARRGVEVRMVLDAIGAKNIDPADIERLQDAGCQVGWFNKVASYTVGEANYRTHRNALVIDGGTAFVGGIRLADHWLLNTGKFNRWRDTQIEVRGPAAIDVEAAFNQNWIETGGVVEPDLLLHDPRPDSAARSIVVWSSREAGANAMKLLYLLAIASARTSLDIESPYLITDESTEWSLAEARRRGVKIRMLVEGDVTDAKPVKFASRAAYERFMEQGIEIYEYQPSMMHAKALTVDGTLSIVGSANFDNRSLELNDELNIAVFDKSLAGRLRSDFETDLTQSKKLDLDEWRARAPHIRAREKMWSYFGEVF